MVPLKEGGQSIPVTNENKREYVQLSAEYRLVLSIKEQIEAFLSGFYEIIPKDLIAIVRILTRVPRYRLIMIHSSTNKSSNS